MAEGKMKYKWHKPQRYAVMGKDYELQDLSGNEKWYPRNMMM